MSKLQVFVACGRVVMRALMCVQVLGSDVWNIQGRGRWEVVNLSELTDKYPHAEHIE